MQKYIEPNPVIDGVAANAAAASRTAILDCRNDTDVGVAVSLVYGAATALNTTLYQSADGGVSYVRMPSISVLAGTGTLSDYTATKPTGAANTDYGLSVDMRGWTHLKIIVSATGGGASDLITVKACHGQEA